MADTPPLAAGATAQSTRRRMRSRDLKAMPGFKAAGWACIFALYLPLVVLVNRFSASASEIGPRSLILKITPGRIQSAPPCFHLFINISEREAEPRCQPRQLQAESCRGAGLTPANQGRAAVPKPSNSGVSATISISARPNSRSLAGVTSPPSWFTMVCSP